MFRSLKQPNHSVLAGLLLFGLSSGIVNAATPMPELPKGKGFNCVAPVEQMRRDHMARLMQQKEDTVHHGIRGENNFSLKGCVSCHAQKDAAGNYIPVNAPGQFCRSCHEYAAVSADCFQCHATKPGAN